MRGTITSYGEDEELGKKIFDFLSASGVEFDRTEPIEARTGDNLNSIFNKTVGNSDLSVFILDKHYISTDLGQKFLNMAGLVSIQRPDKKIAIVRLDNTHVPRHLEHLPSTFYKNEDDFNSVKQLLETLIDP